MVSWGFHCSPDYGGSTVVLIGGFHCSKGQTQVSFPHCKVKINLWIYPDGSVNSVNISVMAVWEMEGRGSTTV